jgi:hypothetical protein
MPVCPLQAKHATQRISFDLPKRRVWMCREAAVPFEAQPVAPRKCESRSLAARRSPRALRRPPAARNDARGKGGASNKKAVSDAPRAFQGTRAPEKANSGARCPWGTLGTSPHHRARGRVQRQLQQECGRGRSFLFCRCCCCRSRPAPRAQPAHPLRQAASVCG